jgi:hypothetical protein
MLCTYCLINLIKEARKDSASASCLECHAAITVVPIPLYVLLDLIKSLAEKAEYFIMPLHEGQLEQEKARVASLFPVARDEQ